MGSNTVPTTAGALIQLGKEALAGLTSLGAALKITILTPAQLQADLHAFTSADNAYNEGRSTQQTASDAFHAADEAIVSWLGDVRKVLAAHFGNHWNTQWAQAGYVNRTTAAPRKIDDRLALCARVAAFFTAHSTYEVDSLEVTAAHANALETEAQTTRQAWTNATQALTTIGDTWDAAFTKLTDDLWSLIKVLQATLDGNDPRWLAFGLQMPDTITTPGQPVQVTAHTDETGTIIVQCEEVARATRYRWRTLLVGLQTNYVLAASGKEPLAALTGFAPGQTVEIVAQAVNGALQGVASVPIQFTMPIVRAKMEKAESATATAEVPVVKGFTHRSGNGNGHAVKARAA